MHTVILQGCAPTPLAHYLKALGILRLVAEQVDASATGCWRRDAFVLRSSLDADGIAAFFLERYRPTPVLAPWNNDGGFFEKSRKAGRETLHAVECSASARLAPYRDAISRLRSAIHVCKLTKCPEKDAKEEFLAACRNVVPDNGLGWLDAAVVLTSGGAKYPPLLGSGGNDGSLEFTKNFMQRIVEVLEPSTGASTPLSFAWIRQSLFAVTTQVERTSVPIGQFFPSGAGGANATSGFSADSAANPWDFILMIEGTLLFAAASVKRLESAGEGALAYPFCVRQAGVGYASAAMADESAARAEMWLPLWENPTALGELTALLSEGRAQVGKRPARNGVDFTRAVVTLGVDRGLSAFQRYGFQVRNGLAYFATPLERIEVRPNVRANLLCDVDPWLDRLRRFGADAPASVARAWRGVESAILELCHHDDSRHFRDLLAALGRAERALARSFRWSTGKDQRPPQVRVSPLSRLSAAWLTQADDGSDSASDCEFRLAASLASAFGGALRSHLEPVERGRSFWKWSDNPGNDVCWNEGSLEAVLHAIVARRLATGDKAPKAGVARRFAGLADIETFLHGRTDDDLIADLWWALSAIEWPDVETESPPGADAAPSAIYALLRLCLPQEGELAKGEEAVPVVPTIFAKARAGHSRACSEAAVRRLRASGLRPRLTHIDIGTAATRRAVAALLLPLARRDFAHLGEAILRAESLVSR